MSRFQKFVLSLGAFLLLGLAVAALGNWLDQRNTEFLASLTDGERTDLRMTQQDLTNCDGSELIVFKDGHVEQVGERYPDPHVMQTRMLGGSYSEIHFSLNPEWMHGIKKVVEPTDIDYAEYAKKFVLQ